MTKVKNIERIRSEKLEQELNHGGRFVVFYFTFSIVLFASKEHSYVYFLRSGESAFPYHFPFTLLTILLGWWSIPFGPFYTIQTIIENFSGGIDVTDIVLSEIKNDLGKIELKDDVDIPRKVMKN
jgi:hypothetical protein